MRSPIGVPARAAVLVVPSTSGSNDTPPPDALGIFRCALALPGPQEGYPKSRRDEPTQIRQLVAPGIQLNGFVQHLVRLIVIEHGLRMRLRTPSRPDVIGIDEPGLVEASHRDCGSAFFVNSAHPNCNAPVTAHPVASAWRTDNKEANELLVHSSSRRAAPRTLPCFSVRTCGSFRKAHGPCCRDAVAS